MNKDATPFIPGKNLNATPFIPSSAQGAPSLSAGAPSFTPGTYGQRQQGPPPRTSPTNQQQQQQQQAAPFVPPPPPQQQQYVGHQGGNQQQQGYYNNQPPRNNNFNNHQHHHHHHHHHSNFNNNGNRNNNYNNNNNGGNFVHHHHHQHHNQFQNNNFNNNNMQNNKPYYSNNNNQNNQNNNNQNNQNNNNRVNNQQQQQQHQKPAPPTLPLSQEQVRTLLPKSHRPLVFLFLGARGSGKSTQSKRLAERLGLSYFSSGAVFTEGTGADPMQALFDELTKIVGDKNNKEGDDKSETNLRGIVLDRVIVSGSVDALGLLHMLHHRFNLQLDMTLVLNGDYLTAQERAEERDKDNDKKNSVGFGKRMIEHSAVYDATENILQPYGGLVNIDVNAGDTVEVVAKSVNEQVDKYLLELKSSGIGHLRTRAFPRLKLQKIGNGIMQDPDVELWIRRRDELQYACDPNLPKHLVSRFPGSNVGNVLTDHTLKDTIVPYARKMFVTYKADGVRVLLVRTQSHGTFLVTAKFLCRFVFDEVEKFVTAQREDPKQTKVQRPKWFPLGMLPRDLCEEKNTVKVFDETTKQEREASMENPFNWMPQDVSNVTHVIDAELVNFENNPELTAEQQAKLPPWRIYGFDCLVANGKRMHGEDFRHRYRAISSFFEELDTFEFGSPDKSTVNAQTEKRFVVKPFLPVPAIKDLLSNIPEFPIDGLLFQQPSKYIVPRDTRNFKWKIPSQCTVDFRLSNGWFDEERKVWTFIPCVIGFRTSGAGDENNASTAATTKEQPQRDEIPFVSVYTQQKALVEIPDSEIGNFCDGSIAECVQLRRELPSSSSTSGKASYQAPNSTSANSKQKLNPTQQMIQNHPLSQAFTELMPDVKRKVPGFYEEFWRTKGGGLQSSDKEYVTVEVSLWKVVRDRTIDKPTPNLDEVALATAHMKHVSLEQLVMAVAPKR